MEATGGLSVADLVERHTGSRPNLPVPPPPAPSQPRMPAGAPPQAAQPPRRPARPTDGPPNGRRPQGPSEGSANWPRQPNGRPAAGGPQNPPSGGRFPPASGPRPILGPAQPSGHFANGANGANGRGPDPDRRAPQPSGHVPNGSGPRDPRPIPGPAQPTGQFANGGGPRGSRPIPGPAQPSGHYPNGRPERPHPDLGARQGTATQSGPRQPAPGPPRQGTATQSGPRDQRFAKIPNQVPGQASMPPSPPTPAWPNEPPSTPAMAPAQPAGKTPPPAPRRPGTDDMDPICLTTEMEPISEETQKRRQVDHTLARFSKVHDELRAEEREKKAKRRKLLPWSSDDELDRLDEIAALQTPALPDVPIDQSPPTELIALSTEDGPVEETRLQKKKNLRRQRSALVGKALAGATAILVFAATGVAWGFKLWVDSNQHKVDALDPNSSAIMDRAAQNGDENFLMVGSDTREGAAAEDNVGTTNKVGGARADTIMIAHVPANRARAVIISFPRDLEVNRPACEEWDDKTGKYNGKPVPPATNVKLNSIYFHGGPKCVTKVVQELSGIAINHFVGIDFNGFKEMVDVVEGVQVCVERPLKDDILGTIVKEAGTAVNLTGDQALNFVRARHVRGDPTSDYGRIIRQQRFLSALLRKAMSTQVLLDPGKLTGFVQAFSRSTFGDNIGVDQLFLLGQSMQGLEAGRVTFITVPTVGEANPRGNEVLRKNDNDALFKAVRNDQALPGETPGAQNPSPTTAPPPTQQVDPKTIKLQVLNGGNKTTKIATKTGDKLKAFGYQIVRVDNALETVKQTVVKYGKDKEAAARVLASSVPGAQLQEDPTAAGALMLVIGPDYNGEVVAPSGTPAPPPTTELPKNLSTVNANDVTCA